MIELEPCELSAEKLREAVKAECKLGEMEAHEEIAILAEQHTLLSLRQGLAEQYRELIGVYPHQRARLRSALGWILDGAPLSVQEVIKAVRRDHEKNGLASGGE